MNSQRLKKQYVNDDEIFYRYPSINIDDYTYENHARVHSGLHEQNENVSHNNVFPDVSSSKKHLQDDGFVVFPDFFDQATISEANNRLEYILRGHFDRGNKPDKLPRRLRAPFPNNSFSNNFQQQQVQDANNDESSKRGKKVKSNNNIGALGFSGNFERVKVLQVINAHKSDEIFRKLVTNKTLGELVGKLTGWNGVRLAQDQIWAKPPGAPPLVFHRDSPYFMFHPHEVVTVWVALDSMTEDIGPLVYVKKSHKWGDKRIGSSQDFFGRDHGFNILRSAAQREGILSKDDDDDNDGEEMKSNYERNMSLIQELDFVSMSGLKAGGITIHDGKTWHGSAKNGTLSFAVTKSRLLCCATLPLDISNIIICTKKSLESRHKPRRGLGIHYVPADVVWTKDALKSRLWSKYVQIPPEVKDNLNHTDEFDYSALDIPEDDFPIIWRAGLDNNI